MLFSPIETSKSEKFLDSLPSSTLSVVTNQQGKGKATIPLIVHNNKSLASGIISIDSQYDKLLKKAMTVATTNATVLITGETGTGKELLADFIHQNSKRANTPIIKVNCATLPKELIESELFGHERGAFTNAYQKRIGKFEYANNKTILLDEIGEFPLALQAKLLRVLQEGTFERIGSNRTQKVNLRVIASTNKDLLQQVKDKQFRADLYYRLRIYPLHSLPLRERQKDILPLTIHFVNQFNQAFDRTVQKIKQNDLTVLQQYNFPGNIRELEHIIERAIIESSGTILNLDSFLRENHGNNSIICPLSKWKTFEELQRDYILRVLRHTQGRVSGPRGAAKILGLNARTLESKMRKFQISRTDALVNE